MIFVIGCPQVVDNLILIEGSAFANSDSPDILEDFILRIIEQFTVSASVARFAVVQYGSDAATEINFGEADSISDLVTRFKAIQYTSTPFTETYKGFETATTIFSSTSRNFAAKHIYLLTGSPANCRPDINSTQCQHLAVTSAEQLWRDDVVITAIDVGSTEQVRLELVSYVGGVESRVFSFDPNNFLSIFTALLNTSCPGMVILHLYYNFYHIFCDSDYH